MERNYNTANKRSIELDRKKLTRRRKQILRELGLHMSQGSVFKILPSLILFLALLSTDRRSRSSGGSVLLCIAALFFSMLGDVFGEWKGGDRRGWMPLFCG